MSLNGQLGLGFLFEAKDLASGVMQKVHGNLSGLSGASETASARIGTAFTAAGVGLSMFGAGIAGLALLQPAIAETTELGKAIALVATETDEATFPQKAMREEVERLARTFGNLPVDEAKALYKAVALGANDAAKSQAFLNGVNLLAVAGNADLEMSANALGGALNAYHADFKEATAYSDAFFTAMRLGNTTVQDLAASVGRVTATAAGLNISIDEILGAVAVMTNQGVKADEAVSGLKEALANVVHPSADAAKEAARLGIKFNQTELRAKGLQGFLKEITSSSRFTASSMSKLFTSVEGANAIMQVTSGNMSFFNDTMVKMGQKAGATQKGFDIMTETLDFQQKKLEANKKAMLGMIGSALEPFAAKVLGFANRAIEAFTKLPAPLVKFLSVLAGVISVGLVAVGGVIALVSAFGALSFAAEAIGVSFAGVIASIAPVLVVVAAVALASATLYEVWKKNLGGIQQFVGHAVQKIQLAMQALFQVFSTGGFSGEVRKELNKAENSGIEQFAINAFVWFSRIKNFFSGLVDSFEAGLKRSEPMFHQLWEVIGRIADALGVLVSGPNNPTEAANTFDAFGRAGKTAGDEIVFALQIVTDLLVDTLYFIDGVIEGWEYMTKAMSPLTDSIGGLFDQLSQLWIMLGFTSNGAVGLGDAMRYTGKAVGVVISAMASAFTQMIGLMTTVLTIINKIADAVTTIYRLAHPTLGEDQGGGVVGTQKKKEFSGAATATPAGTPIPVAASFPAGAEAQAREQAGYRMTSEMAAAIGQQNAPAGAATTHPGTLHATIVLDGEVLQRAQARIRRNDEARSMTPAPIPT